MAFSDALVASWYGKRKPFCWLAPFSKLYSYQVVKRRQAYLNGKKEVYRAPVPVIVVGNITVGGTGKTPLILWLIAFCQAKGLAVGVVSRGYGARPPAYPWRVTAEQTADLAGDEPLLIVKRTQVPLVIDPKRPNAVKELLATEQLDLILCDDGLQHYQLARDLELVMMDSARGLGNGFCLPMGPLREPASRLETVDAVLYNGAEHDTADGFAMQLKPQCFVNLLTGEQQPLTYFFDKPTIINAVAGIGNPERFFNSLLALDFDIIQHAFGDHALYDAHKLNFNNDFPVVMTEKDAVKCKAFAKQNWWYLKVDTEPSVAFVKWVEQKITELVQQKCL